MPQTGHSTSREKQSWWLHVGFLTRMFQGLLAANQLLWVCSVSHWVQFPLKMANSHSIILSFYNLFTQWFPVGWFLPFKGHLAMSRDSFDWHNWKVPQHLVSRGQTCLNNIQCTEQPPQQAARAAPTTSIIWTRLSTMSKLLHPLKGQQTMIGHQWWPRTSQHRR